MEQGKKREKPKPMKNIRLDQEKKKGKMNLKPKKSSKKKVMRRKPIGSKCEEVSMMRSESIFVYCDAR